MPLHFMAQIKQFPISEDYYVRQLQMITNKALSGEKIDWSILKGLSKQEKLTLLNGASSAIKATVDSLSDINDTIEKIISRI